LQYGDLTAKTAEVAAAFDMHRRHIKIHHFIGAFDFHAATAQAETNEKEKKKAQYGTTPFSIKKVFLHEGG